MTEFSWVSAVGPLYTKANSHDQKLREEKETKWSQLHQGEYRRAGLAWPPVYAQEFVGMCSQCRLTEREAEIVHYLDRTCPVALLAIEDELVDLGQNLGRQSTRHSGCVPCVTPGSRLWLRRRRRWMLAPEAIVAQGFDPPRSDLLRRYSHRQVFDVVGNSFHGDSCLSALAVALASAPSLQSLANLQ